MTLTEALDTIEAILIAAQHDGADCGEIADALEAIERLRECEWCK
jgi:hypothetical protein